MPRPRRSRESFLAVAAVTLALLGVAALAVPSSGSPAPAAARPARGELIPPQHVDAPPVDYAAAVVWREAEIDRFLEGVVRAAREADERAAAARRAKARADRSSRIRSSGPAPGGPPIGASLRVSSTAYCLTGGMANGQRAARGFVAMNGVPMGSRWEVEGGPTYTVGDRIGSGSGFDVAMPGDCAGAKVYGRRSLTVTRVG